MAHHVRICAHACCMQQFLEQTRMARHVRTHVLIRCNAGRRTSELSPEHLCLADQVAGHAWPALHGSPHRLQSSCMSFHVLHGLELTVWTLYPCQARFAHS